MPSPAPKRKTVMLEGERMRVATSALVIMAALAGFRGVAPAADVRPVQQAPAITAAFVNAAYQVVFSRPATAADLVYWMNPALASQGQAGVVQAMMNSAQFRQIEIAAVLQHFLGGNATPTLLALAEGGSATMAQVAATVIASPEYYGQAGATTTGFLSKVFLDALGIQIGSSGRAYYTELLAAGGTRATVASQIEQSPAGSAYLNLVLYQNALHRSGTPNGTTLVAAALSAIQQML